MDNTRAVEAKIDPHGPRGKLQAILGRNPEHHTQFDSDVVPKRRRESHPTALLRPSMTFSLGSSEDSIKLLQSYKALKRKVSIEDEFQVWRIELLGIIDEFVGITDFPSAEVMFAEPSEKTVFQSLKGYMKSHLGSSGSRSGS